MCYNHSEEQFLVRIEEFLVLRVRFYMRITLCDFSYVLYIFIIFLFQETILTDLLSKLVCFANKDYMKNPSLYTSSEVVSDLINRNKKLKYRLGILKNVCTLFLFAIVLNA